MNLSMVGYHASVHDLNSYGKAFFNENKVFQVFVGTNRRLLVPNTEGIAKLLRTREGITVVVHAPYTVSLCKNPADPIFIATLQYLVEVAKRYDELGVKYLVTHIGGRSKDNTIGEASTYIWEFCRRWLKMTEGCNIHLCLENDTGSKGGTKMGYIPVLASIVKKLNDPRLRMTYDSEHAYGAGFNPSDNNFSILDCVS